MLNPAPRRFTERSWGPSLPLRERREKVLGRAGPFSPGRTPCRTPGSGRALCPWQGPRLALGLCPRVPQARPQPQAAPAGAQRGRSPPSPRGPAQANRGTAKAPTALCLLSGGAGRVGLRFRPPRPRGPSGATRPPRPEPAPPTYPLLPLTALSQSPHLPRPNKAPPPHGSSPRPVERPPSSHLELGLVSSASAPWNMVALGGGARQLRSTAPLHPRRGESRAPRPAPLLVGLAAHHNKQPIERSSPTRDPACPAGLAEGGKLKTTRVGAHPGCLPLVALPVRQRELHSHWLIEGRGEQRKGI